MIIDLNNQGTYHEKKPSKRTSKLLIDQKAKDVFCVKVRKADKMSSS